MAFNCVINGCALIDPSHERWLWGDVHMNELAFVFVASDPAEWRYGELPDTQANLAGKKPTVTVWADHYFEKRGVIVAELPDCNFNQDALDYIYSARAVRARALKHQRI